MHVTVCTAYEEVAVQGETVQATKLD